MPYYRWWGVTLDATKRKGVLFAPSKESLDALLFKQGIALISYRPAMRFYVRPVSSMSKLFFFEHLQALLAAGVHVWEALNVIGEQMSDGRCADTIYKLSQSVQEGKQLHEAMQPFGIFSQLMVHTTEIGTQTGNTALALKVLCQYLQEDDRFKKRLQSVLLLPLATLTVFLVVIGVILFVIVPQYADLFFSMGKELPRATRLLLKVQEHLVSYYIIGYLFIGVTIGTVFWRLRYSAAQLTFDCWLLRVSYFGPLLQKIALVHFLRALTLLIHGGMSLVPALKISAQAVTNLYIKDRINKLIDAVQEGQSLSAAMQVSGDIFPQDLVLLITVGEETAQLETMVDRAAHMYQQQVQQALSHYTTVLQPLLMLLLGALVAGLIYAVYMPLFNLADIA